MLGAIMLVFREGHSVVRAKHKSTNQNNYITLEKIQFENVVQIFFWKDGGSNRVSFCFSHSRHWVLKGVRA